MTEILKEWLTERLQRPITWESENFGEMMRNGNLIAEILFSYHVINNQKYNLIRSNNTKADIDSNWQYICETFTILDIHLPDAELNNCKEGKGSTLIKLFYQLFLHLDKRDRLDYIKNEQKKASRLVKDLGNRFHIETVQEDKFIKPDILSKPLIHEKELIEWQRKKEKEIKEMHDNLRQKYLKTVSPQENTQFSLKSNQPTFKKLTAKEQLDLQRFTNKHDCKFSNYSYEELINLKQKADEHKYYVIDSDWAKNYIENLQTKVRDRGDSEKFQKQLCSAITSLTFDKTIAEEEHKLDTELARKVMKISQFEKQMCTQIMETKQQARNLMKNRIEAEKQFSEQREQQFKQYFDNIKEQIQLESLEIDFEKERQNMLHKKLYEEKIKRRKRHYYEICYETMLAIVDYAIKYGYYKLLLGNDVPGYLILEWKALLYKNQPVFEIISEIESLIDNHGIEEEMCPDVELILQQEQDRQNCLNVNDFIDYHNYERLWDLEYLIPNFSINSKENDSCENFGLGILGHVVFTLLEIKYPYPPKRLPADLPNFPYRAILRNLPDASITIPMQTLLKNRKIFVVRLETAINYCLNRFKLEMIGCRDIELSFDKFLPLAPEECKDIVNLIKAEQATNDSVGSPKGPNVKQTQTPKVLPEDEIKLSQPAELGKYAYESLSLGNSLTDYLLATTLVEYIKDQHDINGFVILNYPNSYREAQVLEEVFSGRAPPGEQKLDDRDEIYLEQSIEEYQEINEDLYKQKRSSRIVQNPHKEAQIPTFTTYFTSYINLKATDDILQASVIWQLTEDNSELIDRFYACQGINYSMYYENIDKDFLAQLCKYIIGDFSQKSTDNLFGLGVLSSLDFLSTDDKRQKSKIIKAELSNTRTKEKSKRGLKSSKLFKEEPTDIVKDDSVTLNPIASSVVVFKETNEFTESKTNIEEETSVIPGNENWVFGNLPIAESIGIVLTTFWEAIEKSYIHDIEQLFFLKRLQMNCIVPYARFIKDKMEQIITLPSHKQNLVVNFQLQYNNFEDDWRNTNVSKNEWHCRIKELENILCHICDERKVFAERQRQSLITENWTMDELTSMVNTYISCMQTELNRSILTYQLVHDFYYTMLKRPLSSDRPALKELTKISRDHDKTQTKKNMPEDKIFRQIKTAFIEMQLKSTPIDFKNNPFNLVIENNTKFALKVIKDINDSYRVLINKEKSELLKITAPTKTKRDEILGQSESKTEEIFKLNALKCIEEWMTAINGEMCRFNLRIQALQHRCYRDMKLFNDHIFKTFNDIYNDINKNYINEIKSVQRLCKYLQMAVENNRKVKETLILENDTFIIDPNLLYYHRQEQNKLDLEEICEDAQFKMSQLARLRTQFKLVAPTGILMQKDFIYLIQDFIFFAKETCEGSIFPKYWKEINPDDVPKMVYLLYGEAVYVDWRDFLIYCLNLKYPTLTELLDLRKIYRCHDEMATELISRDIFLQQTLWFECDVINNVPPCRKTLIKHFIFELFEVGTNIMNYSAFLLAFCKDIDPVIGFTTALSMAVGKKICNNRNDCEKVIKELIKLKEYKDACKACAHKCAVECMDEILSQVLNICIGTTITEIQFFEPVEVKKSKKSKGSKTKQDGTQSARLPKRKSIDSRSKLTQSATDITYKPVDEAEDEKLPEVIEVQEITHEPIKLDDDVVYSIQQDVIWNVLKVCLPWPFKFNPQFNSSSYVNEMINIMNRLASDTDDGSIYVTRFVNEPSVCTLLHKMRKFHAINITDEVKKLFH